jgi:integrase
LLARTGLRIGEALALQWGDIDFNGRFITIQRGISRGRIETPKNGKSRRVDMSLQLTEALKALKDQGGTPVVVPITRNEGAPEEPSEWVFTNGVGGFIDVNNWRRRVFNKALKKAGLRRIRIHDLRHTYASLLIQAGESLAYVRDQLGHHSIKVTVDIYGHLAPEGNKQAVDKLDDVFPMHLDAPSLHPAPSENKQALRLLNLSA